MLKDRDAVGPTAASPGAPICGGANNGAEPTLCGGCGARITDRYYLLAVDRQWHSACLKCSQCKLPLDSELTCFARDGNIYCKEDYYRLFAVKRCARCQAGISSSELVMRARDLVFHLHCFTCASCGTALAKGDHFGLRDGIIYCRPHYELLYASAHVDFPPCPAASAEAQYFAAVAAAAAATAGASGGAATPGPGAQGAALNSNVANIPNNGVDGSSAAAAAVAAAAAIAAAAAVVQKGRPRKRKLPSVVVEPNEMTLMRHPPGSSLDILHPGELSSSMESLSYDTSVASPTGPPGQQQQRTKRMRTSFKHHQLRTMKSYFAINQNPDAKDLKQLAQKTGLSKRVLQVWFQNARAKWRRNLMRQESGMNPGTNNSTNGGGVVSGNSVNPSTGATSSSVLLGDSNGSLSAASGNEDLTPQTHHHPHQHTTTATAAQTLVFGDLY